MPTTLWIKAAAGAAVLTALGAFWWSWSSRGETILEQQATIGRMSAQLEQAVTVNAELRATMQGERERYRQALDALAKAETQARSRADRLNTIRRDIRDAEDGPVSPVLSRALDGLREAGPGSSDRDEGRSGAPADPAITD
jgi:hypothetical protein